MLDDIKARLFRMSVQSRLKKHRVNHQTVTYENARKIGILFDANKPEHVVRVNRFADNLKKPGLQIEMLGYIEKKGESVKDFKWFDKKEVSWTGIPKTSVPKDFISQEFDILINAWMEPNRSLQYISTFSNAKWRIAPYRESMENIAEFHISLKEGKDGYDDYFDQVDHFVRTIQHGKSASKNTGNAVR